MHYVYILFSKKDGKLYVGRTDNIEKRLTEHSEGRVRSTKNRRPLKLIYFEAFFLKKSAIKQEALYKKGQGRRILKKRLEGETAYLKR
jgi:putative endonuclease